jgi:hypothetical protein
MNRKIVIAAAAALWLTLAGPAAAQKTPEMLGSEATTLYQAAAAVIEPRERGRLLYLVQQRLARISAAYPQSAIAAQIAFGRYGEIDVAVVNREARAWAGAYPADAAQLDAADAGTAAAAGQGTGGGLVPSFGGAAAAPSIVPAFGGTGATSGGSPTQPNPAGSFNVALLSTPPARLAPTELVQRMRDAVVIIFDPAHPSTGTGFFIGPRHLVTNTHVVQQSDRIVVANKTIGVRSARVLYRGMNSQNVGIDTAVLETDGWENPAFLPFAESVQEGEAISIGGYPGRASDNDKAYDQFLKLILENSLPTGEAIPNVKFDFGYVQSVFVHKDTGIENLQNGVNTSGGNSGSPIVNRCGAVVAQHYLGTGAVLSITNQGQAVGDTSKFNYAISGKEVRKFLDAAKISYTLAKGECPQAAD